MHIGKKILTTFITLFALFLLLINYAKFKAKTIHNSYSIKFNSERAMHGLSPITPNLTFEKENWGDFIGPSYTFDLKTDSFVKLTSDYEDWKNHWGVVINRFNEIGLDYRTEQDSHFEIPYLHSKVIEYNTNILFWDNKITSEKDTYKNENDSTKFTLSIEYFYNGPNYRTKKMDTSFYRYDFYSTKKNGIITCGSVALNKGYQNQDSLINDFYTGSTTKEYTDSVLSSWNTK